MQHWPQGEDKGSLDHADTTTETEPSERSKDPPMIGTIHLAILVFYSVAGGPFGIEPTVRSAGAFYALLGFLVFPFVWCIPEAFVTAELSTTFPEASGGVAWVEESFGKFPGWMAGCLSWVAGATDNAIYPALFLDYLLQIVPLDITGWPKFGLLTLICLILVYVNYRGLNVVGNMSLTICVLSLSPFVLFCLLAIPQIDPSRWFQMPEAVDYSTDDNPAGGFLPYTTYGGIIWRTYLNNLFWNLNYFDSASSFAADVRDPGTTFPRAMCVAVGLVALGYLIPLLFALGVSDASQHDWINGYMVTVVTESIGIWLGAWVVFGIAISNLGLFQAELSSDAFKIMGMAERGFLPKLFSRRSSFGTPTYALLLGTTIVILLNMAKLDTLVELLNFNYTLSVLMEYAAFIKLRVSKPDLPRPFRIPLNTTGCILMLIPGILLSLATMALATYITYLYCIGTMVVATVIYMVRTQRRAQEFSYDVVDSP